MSATLPPCVITIDGPAGTGKSTVAKRLADRLGLSCLDTGAMYRALTLLAIESGVCLEDGPALAALAAAADLRFDWTCDPPAMLVGDRDVSERIRELDVTSKVSIVAAQPPVREVLNQAQRLVADRQRRLVTEGRDQGSAVFPDATVRFFLDADVSVRARRRLDQMVAKGELVDPETILQDIRQRDRIDSTRATDPLVRPTGSILIDSTDQTIDEVVEAMIQAVPASVMRESAS